MKKLKVVLTGGPCGGKTTAINEIQSVFEEKGYKVIVVPEAATILINSGIKPFGFGALSMEDFQKYVIDLQLTLERLAQQNAVESDKETIIVCDRGVLDDKAYVDNNLFKKLLANIDKQEIDVMNSYDLVIHLKTAAAGKEEFYTLDNNSARTETPAEARKKDKITLESWLGHDNLKIIGNDTDFKEKINNVIKEIYFALGMPLPIKRQYKYLVDTIDIDELAKLKAVKLEIEQYIVTKDEKDIMYRKTIKDGETFYKKIIKIDTDIKNERITTKKNISEDEFYEHMKDNQIIKKTRYCFAYQNEYFRLDIFKDGLMVLEIEETDKSKDIEIPDFIKIKKDITNDKLYRNSNLSKGLTKKL